MKILFTKNGLPLSRLIRWVLNEPCSHVALVFNDNLVFHSNLFGVKIEYWSRFAREQTIVHEYPIALSPEVEKLVREQLFSRYDGKGYDFGALFYFGVRGLLYRAFGLPLPQKNAWNSDKAYLCTEIVSCLPVELMPKSFQDFVQGTDLGIISPEQLFERLKG